MSNSIMQYNRGTDALKNWIVTESAYNPKLVGKAEAIFCLGNGYMGQRAAAEEKNMGETRNLFVAGTFNKFADNEVTELPNAADVLWMDFTLDGQAFNLEQGTIVSYERVLNIKEAELTRKVVWTSNENRTYELTFRRFISLDDKHVIAQRVEITPVDQDAEISITSGINAQVSNSGVQHFKEGEKRLFDKKIMQLIQTTTESNIDFVFNTAHQFEKNNEAVEVDGLILMERRQIYYAYNNITVAKGETLVIEKLTNVFTSRDKDVEVEGLKGLKTFAKEHLEGVLKAGYNTLFTAHAKAWEEKVWSVCPITIETAEDFDQLAIRFAQYHLTVFTPAHDNRMNVGAKGLSGEGYKGHTFWDTELFVLPYFIYSHPKVARSLLEYRYLTLPGAHKKAKENGYEGAMFPWESAWLEDGEVTPVWGAADIITGEATKIWSGFIEQHITSDIAFATWQYYQITGDEDFMEKYGYELLLDTAKFWQSRLEWNEEKQEFHINNVIGPDEYKEHVNNNAFTNYTAHWTIKNAMAYYNMLKADKPEIFARLNEKLDLDATYEKWVEKVDKIYLPQPRQEDLVIGQDDTYLSKEIIDLTKYKNQENVGSMFKDYNLTQVNEIQVSKQADIMVLFYLLEDLFSQDVKKANWEYYEPKTLHDSSLSLSTHCVLASDMGDKEMAYNLFNKACAIDLGPNMKTSDHGIHAASLGGIWQCVVNGFGGVRMLNGKLRIVPALPEKWTSLTFPIFWQGDRLEVTVTKNTLTVKKVTNNNEEITFTCGETEYTVKDQVVVEL
ncbi:glycoside hydrolase family 65 protein [Bacillus massiliigorillae]|uniref:glycoside hydrolase family 65 protein n=1 Tax=Bacillus massiliigorillae TaxID=1243664 RepID=UPI00039E14DD|nr:glycosyl hydrolase family 65 protein [Bacillus massiliigorillae]